MISLHTAQRLSQEDSKVTLTIADRHFLKKCEKKIDNEILVACDINEQSFFIKSVLVFDKGYFFAIAKGSKKYLKYKKRFELFLTLLDKYKVQGYEISYTSATYNEYYEDCNYLFLDHRLKGIITNLEIKWDKDYNPISSKDEADSLIEKYEK